MTEASLDSRNPLGDDSEVVKRLLLLALLFAPIASAKPKIAVVDIDTIFTGFSRKLTVEKEVANKIEALKQSPRVLAVQEMDTKLKELAATVRDKTKDPETRELAAEEFNSLAIEHQSLLQEMEKFLQEEKLKATRQLVDTVEKLIGEIRAEISRVGKEQNFDMVLEVGGRSSSQVSPIIYLREKTDLTSLVLERLNAEGAAAENN